MSRRQSPAVPADEWVDTLAKAKAMRPDVTIIMIAPMVMRKPSARFGAEALLTKPIDFGTL